MEGTFDATDRGHLGAFGGALVNVSRLLELTRWYDGKIQLKKQGSAPHEFRVHILLHDRRAVTRRQQVFDGAYVANL